EALEVIEGVVECMNFQFAAVAGTGIHFADGEAASKPAPRGAFDACGQLGERGVGGRGWRLGQWAAREALEQGSAHATFSSISIVSRGNVNPVSWPGATWRAPNRC